MRITTPYLLAHTYTRLNFLKSSIVNFGLSRLLDSPNPPKSALGAALQGRSEISVKEGLLNHCSLPSCLFGAWPAETILMWRHVCQGGFLTAVGQWSGLPDLVTGLAAEGPGAVPVSEGRGRI